KQRQRGNRVLERHVHTLRDRCHKLETVREVVNRPDRLVRTGRQHIRNPASLSTVQVELLQRDTGDLRSPSHTQLSRRRQVQRTSQTATENVGSPDTRLPKLLDRVSRFGGGEHRRPAGLQRGILEELL